MEQDQEQSHVCRRGSKSFLTGKADLEVCTAKMIVKADGENGYAPRENTTKSWKSKDDDANSAQENQCKVCEKEFESKRALYGHMRHHSKKRKKGVCCKECGKNFQSLKALAAHVVCHSEEHKVSDKSESNQCQKPISESLSDCEKLSSLVRRKRSKRTRHMNGQNSSLFPSNESSSLVKYEQEIEEVALSLMMLSRSVRDFDSTVPAAESSEKNSVIFEVKSSGQSTKFVHNEAGSFAYGANGSMKTEAIALKKVSSVLGDSQIMSDEKQSHESNSKPLLKPNVIDNTQLYDEQTGTEPLEFCLRKKANLEACLAQSKGNSGSDNEKLELTESLSDQGMGGITMTEEEPMGIKQHKCSVCLKVFATGQGLGGHKKAHSSKNSQFSEEAMLLEQETSETSDDLDFDIPATLKEDAEGDLPIISWRVGCEQKHELMVV